MATNLSCLSCGRSADMTADASVLINYQGQSWCVHCADVRKMRDRPWVAFPSPGLMSEDGRDDPVQALFDCYEMTPKKRILVARAKVEIQRAWDLWSGDKTNEVTSMFEFYFWLGRYRPYFLTFRHKGDRWQTIHAWLIQHTHRATITTQAKAGQ